MKIKQKSAESMGEFIPVKVTFKTESEAEWFYAMLQEMAYGRNCEKSCEAFDLDLESMREAEETISWLVELSDVEFSIKVEKNK